MKSLKIAFLILSVYSAFLWAQQKHSLWQITGGRNQVYLLGSVHLLDKDQYPLPEVFDKAFDQSEIIVFEVNLDSADLPEVQRKFINKGLFTKDTTLQDVLSDSVFTLVKNFCSQTGVPLQAFQKMKPWMLSLSLMQLKLKQMQFDPKYGIDQYFYRKAKKAKKKIQSLETIDFQIDLFGQFSLLEQNKLIQQTIEELNDFEKKMNLLVNAWNTGNASLLDSLMNESFSDYPKLYDKLLVRRNLNWLKKIERFLKLKNNYLVIVGAGHLVGEQGIIRMLKSKGYRVKQL
ncbi:MAG: TraB/GumN family protein [Calditrichaeota bacterium]|nr:TraB/GumN family protein [Calditrichota bacterium]